LIEYGFKILILGDGAVGKTTFLQRLQTGKFQFETKVTIGADFHIVKIKVKDKVLNINIWDIGGQPMFRFLVPAYRKGCSGVIIMYDTTRTKSIFGMEEWADLVHEEDPNIPIIIAGSKMDLEVQKELNEDNVTPLVEKFRAFAHQKCSSKTGEGIHEIVMAMAKKILEKKDSDFSPEDLDEEYWEFIS
jgi:small GTP-binding protein